jgi:Tol biopolymer transport system component
VRSGPGTDYSIIAKVTSGQSVQIVERGADGAWSQIVLPDQPTALGWVASRFIAGGAAAAAPLAATATVNNAAPAPATVTSAPAGGLRGKLVFQDRQGGTIYLYALDSGALTTLTRGFDPSLSPDGSRVVFTRGGGENGIYLINSDGSDEHKIFGERELLRSPKWSPDGQWIVFERGDEFNKCYIDKETGACFPSTPFDTKGLETGKDHVRKLARIDPNGNSYRDLAVVEEAMAPDWSNGGIVYQSDAGLQITKDAEGDPNRKLYFDIKRQYHQDPDWQPGGDRIVFQQRQGSHYEIFAINQDGGGLTGLTRPATALVDQMPSNVAPAWSPDGSQIVFLSNRTATNEAGPWHLWIMNRDGSNQQQLPINVTLQYDYVTEQMVDWGR